MGGVTAPWWPNRGDVVVTTDDRPWAWVVSDSHPCAHCALLVRPYSNGATHHEWVSFDDIAPAPADHPDWPALLEAMWAI